MKTFKIVFDKNEIVLCLETDSKLPEEKDCIYEEDNGMVAYAFVRAGDINEACHKANNIVSEVKRHYPVPE